MRNTYLSLSRLNLLVSFNLSHFAPFSHSVTRPPTPSQLGCVSLTHTQHLSLSPPSLSHPLSLFLSYSLSLYPPPSLSHSLSLSFSLFPFPSLSPSFFVFPSISITLSIYLFLPPSFVSLLSHSLSLFPFSRSLALPFFFSLSISFYISLYISPYALSLFSLHP